MAKLEKSKYTRLIFIITLTKNGFVIAQKQLALYNLPVSWDRRMFLVEERATLSQKRPLTSHCMKAR